MFSEVAITTSNTDSHIYVWDIRSGTVLGSFKQSTCNAHALALANTPLGNGRPGLVLSAQNDKALMHAYSWTKDQIHLKFPFPEKITTLATTNKGTFCVGGTESGKIYVWEVSTGNLLSTFDAHYKKITVLRFSQDDTVLFTGSEDSAVNVWLLNSIIDESNAQNRSPLYSWSDHSLPITDIHCGSGGLKFARVVTSSLDHTCKVWDLASGSLLTTLLFPSFVSAVAMDITETRVFAATGDSNIYQVNMYKSQADRGHSSFESVGGMGTVVSAGINGESSLLFKGHTEPAHSLALSFDGTLLISGSEDGSAMVWDVTSRQMLRSFTQHKGPITNVAVILKPADLMNTMAGTTVLPTPIQPFKRIQKSSQEARLDEGVLRYLPGAKEDMAALDKSVSYEEWNLPYQRDLQHARATLQSQQRQGTQDHLRDQITDLQGELVRIHDHYQRVRNLNDELYQGAVTEFMKQQRAEHNDDV
ncbi:WD40 repeat-like protein [Basidiobolus meristosporus CBS 931.73]|uniref:WD40 repeat-like protein n=1 Tax=Basidiobolus meristosporus CBS 931.73 TaxID=1314790 RepID=A0A1Y1Y9C6_9FUNG|nr:WD40 repeat-like protein [Basidiobolus meristosporus CBS 931.73]|eukprot:ORX94622.1 WD40 repeat-like protein [Basidiobolus meristosporus CBS 931.73]